MSKRYNIKNGDKFGRLTVIKEVELKNSNKNRILLCLCDCGNIKNIRLSHLIHSGTKSCGCLRAERGIQIKDLDVKKYGMLTVLYRVPPISKNKRIRWMVKCDCGIEKEIDGFHLTRKKSPTKSCGCTGNQKLFKTKSKTHYRRLYNIWHSMIFRCENKKCSDYHKYGARGIRVSEQWHDFTSFYDDMIDTYMPRLTIERINNNGNYCKENCKWIRNEDQAKNRRTTIWVDGLCAKDACKKYGINYQTFLSKKNIYKWDIQKIIDTYRTRQ